MLVRASTQSLPPLECNGWHVATTLNDYAGEARGEGPRRYEKFSVRMADQGLGPLLGEDPPRKKCRTIQSCSRATGDLLLEFSQRRMIAAVRCSIPTYASGIRCWAAFCDACSIVQHFPAQEEDVLRYTSVFSNAHTLDTYLKHLRWAHRFLRLPNGWDTPAVAQVRRGSLKEMPPHRPRLALQAAQVRSLIGVAEQRKDYEQAALLAVGRLFLFRMPSECFPLQLCGEHSSVEVHQNSVTITLASRKNSRGPSVLQRDCCCKTAGKRLCAHRWLRWAVAEATEHKRTRLFMRSVADFIDVLRSDATQLGIPQAEKLGTHALRRGMARDILDAGGSLAVLLRAGGWRSSAFAGYLRENQVEDRTVFIVGD